MPKVWEPIEDRSVLRDIVKAWDWLPIVYAKGRAPEQIECWLTARMQPEITRAQEVLTRPPGAPGRYTTDTAGYIVDTYSNQRLAVTVVAQRLNQLGAEVTELQKGGQPK